jgi:O-antigen/teichoic acid export membrane protein
LSIVVAREVDVEAFGAFAFAFGLYSLCLGISRSASSQPLVVQYSAQGEREARLAMQRSLGTALTCGSAFGVPILAVGAALGSELGLCLVVLGVGLPGLLVQDAVRYCHFTSRTPKGAFSNDLCWVVLQGAFISLLLVAGTTGSAVFLAAWALAAFGAAVYGLWRARLVPRVTQTRAWLRENAQLSPYLAADYAVSLGSVNVLNILLAATGNLNTVAALRGAQVLLAPLRTFFYAAESVWLAEMTNRIAHQGRSVRGEAALISGVLAAVAAVATVVALLIPTGLGVALLGATWSSARPVVGWSGLMLMIIGLMGGATLGLQILQRSRSSMNASLLQAPFVIGLGMAGQATGGVSGAAAGLALAHLVGLLSSWRSLLRLSQAGPPGRSAD